MKLHLTTGHRRLACALLKAVPKPPRSKRWHACRGFVDSAKRLECGALTVLLLLGGPPLLRAQPANAMSEEIPPLAPPLPEIPPTAWEQYGWLLWIALPMVLALVAVVLWFALRPGAPPLLPAPATQARSALLALQAQPEDSASLTHISRALRQYLTVTFWLPPLEMTTQDFCACLAAHERIDPGLAEELGGFLRSCDELKFAPNATRPPWHAASRAMGLVDKAEAMRIGPASQPATTVTPASA